MYTIFLKLLLKKNFFVLMKNILSISLLILISVFILSNCGMTCNHKNMEEYIAECDLAYVDGEMRRLYFDNIGFGGGKAPTGCYYLVDGWEKLVDLCNPDLERKYVDDDLCTNCETYKERWGG